MPTSHSHRRPKQEIEELVLHNTRNDGGEWVPQMFRKGSWIFMQPSAIGPHRVPQRGTLEHHWKGRLLGFKKNKDNGMVAIVQHVFSIPNMRLRQENRWKAFTSNCKLLKCYLSLCDEYLTIFEVQGC